MSIIDHPAAGLGTLVRPGDPGWDRVRQAFNLLVDQQPEAVALPADEREVAAVIGWARERGLRVAAQATGHNAGPLGPLEGTVLLNTARLDALRIDAAARRVRVGAGVKWQRLLPELSGLGLAALHGSSPDVGVVGYSLGGGLGWLGRRHGLQCNAVTAIELVTADGSLIRTDEVHEPELFWALRGGGGSFGIVTAIEFTVLAVPELYAGALLFDAAQAGAVLRRWRDALPSFPDELTSWASVLHVPDVPFAPEPLRGRSLAILSGALLGDEAQGRELLAPLRELGPMMDSFAMVPPLALAELAMDPPEPLPYRTGHELLSGLDDATIDAAVALLAPGSPLGGLQLRHLGGALGRAGERAGARATLPGEIASFAFGLVVDEASAAAVPAALAQLAALFAPASAGAYPSFVEVPDRTSRFFDPSTWERLRSVKALYDPADTIRGNHHVAPSAR
ncbi:MAG: FAD/FMN-containing dehydrogenase [Solirubrobacterales bacterium]|nr:FAD/FMN-containing dehydrogenase [Solirubrobacterales bacterium]